MTVSDVQSTLFFPLLGRAEATRRWPKVFPDPWAHRAEEIAREEKTTARSMGPGPASVYGLRHLITLSEIRRYLRAHPGAAIVNIGCGLDRPLPDLEGELGEPGAEESSTIYNLDYPDVLRMRARWVEPSAHEVDLPYSATDLRWMDEVDGSRGMIAIAAGVFFYFETEGVRAVVTAMAERFPGGRLAYDSESPAIIRKSESTVRKNGVAEAPMPFKVSDPFIARSWSDRVQDVRVEFNFTHYLPKELRAELPLWVRAFFAVMQRVRGMYEVVVDFAEEI